MFETIEEVQLCQCKRPCRMGDVRCGTMVRCRMCRNELLYRLSSVGGECKIDDHDRVLASGDGVGRDD